MTMPEIGGVTDATVDAAALAAMRGDLDGVHALIDHCDPYTLALGWAVSIVDRVGIGG